MDFQLGAGTEEALGANRAFMNVGTTEFVIAVLTPMETGLQRTLFEQQLEDPEMLADMMGMGMQLSGAGEAETEFEELTVEGIGEVATGIQVRISLEGMIFVYDVILFSRDNAGAVVGVMHPEGADPAVDAFQLAELVDARLMELPG